MPIVAELLAVKGNLIHDISLDASVLDAVRRMNQQQIGALVVMESDRVAGMFTERDVLRRVLEEARPLDEVTMREVMTKEVICCAPEMDIEDASRIMMERKIRHLPVCDGDGKLKGLISIGDLNAFYASAREQTLTYLTDYIYGRG